MKTLQFIPANDPSAFSIIESLAGPIWQRHYTPIVGAAQVDYMLEKFQSAETIARQIREGMSYYLIHESSSGDIGYLAVQPKDGELFLSKFYIEQGHRGKGFGRQAMDFVKKTAREKGASRITLTVHQRNPSVEVYKKLGFAIVGPVFTDIGEGFVMDDFRMEWIL